MGNVCDRLGGRKGGLSGSLHGSSIVPDQDPRCKVVLCGSRVVYADLARDFDLRDRVLGTGYSGAVRLAEQRQSRQQVAVKQFRKRGLKEHRLRLLKGEVEVYLRLDHPNICRLLYAYEKGDKVWLVMELCGCELYTRLCQQKVYGERDAAGVMTQMMQAVSYLHNHKVVHRDLKLENWMYGATDNDDRLKLIDFGFSRVLVDEGEELDMPCGTLHYTSPEVLQRKYTSQCDMWSLGVICYMLLMGRPPFRAPNDVRIAKAIMNGGFTRDSKWNALSAGARCFIEGLLLKDASKRMDASTALGHRWLRETAPLRNMSWAVQPNVSFGPGTDRAPSPVRQLSSDGAGSFEGMEVLRSLRKFARGSHLQRAALTVLAYSLTSREIQEFEQVFLDMDISGRGTVTLEQLEMVMKERYPNVSSEEVQRIFDCVDVSNDEEIYYTSFIAAMLATRVRLHEDKVRAAFEAFDTEGTGYITADSLKRVFAGSQQTSRTVSILSSMPSVPTCTSRASRASRPSRSPVSLAASSPSDRGDRGDEAQILGGLTQEEAEEWIREVDYKGNGVVDYEGFLSALTGKHLWASVLLESDDQPAVRVFEEEPTGRRRCFSESNTGASLRHRVLSAIIDHEEEKRSQSFSLGMNEPTSKQVSLAACKVDETYF